MVQLGFLVVVYATEIRRVGMPLVVHNSIDAEVRRSPFYHRRRRLSPSQVNEVFDGHHCGMALLSDSRARFRL